MLKKTISLLICSLGLLVVAGCSDGMSNRIGVVKGRITIEDEPMAGVSVMFTPMKTIGKSGRVNPISFGVTDAEGHFELSMPGGEAGAVTGNHRVLISEKITFESALHREAYLSSNPFPHPFEKVPAEFNLESKVYFLVKAGENEANFEVGRRSMGEKHDESLEADESSLNKDRL